MDTTDRMTSGSTATYMVWVDKSRHEGVPCVEHYPIENWSRRSLESAVSAFYDEIIALRQARDNWKGAYDAVAVS